LFCVLIVRRSSVDIPMSEGPVNLNWGPIMKHINDSPFEFFQQGGWGLFLGGAGGVEVSVTCRLIF
jgi:nucleosome binding factor SPN SPT16 subunit